MTRDEARNLLDDYIDARDDLYDGDCDGDTVKAARIAVLDAMTADQERPVTETEPGIGEVVYAPFGPRPVWRAAFKTCERWYWCTFDDQARFAYPLDEPPRTYRPILPAPKEAK